MFDLLFNIDSIFPYVSILLKEFDNYAEWDLKDIDFVDDDSDVLRGGLHFVLMTTKQQQCESQHLHYKTYELCRTCSCFSALKLAVVDIYHSRLKERQRRKK